MRIAGAWVGWGAGPPRDVDPKVADMKRFLKRKFGWVRDYRVVVTTDEDATTVGLDDSEVYDDVMVAVVMELQKRYSLPVTGIMNAATQTRCGYWVPPKVVKILPVAMTVQGTAQPDPLGPGLPADTARYCESIGICNWQGIGNYPATAFPMWGSIMQGVNELGVQVNRYSDRKIWLAGYSQGAVVVSHFYKYMVQDPAGPFHHRLKDIEKIVVWGNPMRQQGVCHWDGGEPQCGPDTAGILGDRMEHTPPFWRDYGHAADLYAGCELDDEGEHKRMICSVIMGSKMFSGSDSVIAQLIELGMNPLGEGMAAFRAIMDAGLFFGRGTRAHMYDIRPAIDFLRQN